MAETSENDPRLDEPRNEVGLKLDDPSAEVHMSHIQKDGRLFFPSAEGTATTGDPVGWVFVALEHLQEYAIPLIVGDSLPLLVAIEPWRVDSALRCGDGPYHGQRGLGHI